MVALHEFEETLPAELTRKPRCVVGKVREHHASLERTEDGGHIYHSAFSAETGEFYYAGYEDIERWAPKGDERLTWIDARLDEWRQDGVRLCAAREAAGITPYQDALSAAQNAQYDAAQQLLKTEPTTIAGVVALIRYCAAGYEEMMPDGDDPMTLLQNCAAALEKIGGRSLPTPLSVNS